MQRERTAVVGVPSVDLSTFLNLAIPSACLTILTNSYRVVDQFYMQSVSVAAQAAIGSSVFVLILYYALFECVSAGVGPLVARATGAGDGGLRRELLGSGLMTASAGALGVMAIGIAGSEWIARSLGLGGESAAACSQYVETISWTILPLALTPVVDQAFLAMGNARVPLVLHFLALVLNMVLTPLFMFVAGWGVAGAALASSLARGVATAIGIWQLRQVSGLGWTDCRWRQTGRIIGIGAPMGVATGLFAAVYWVLLQTSVSPLGPEVNAALGIGFSALEGCTWPVFHGVAQAVASMVGRCLGAREPLAAHKVVRLAVPVATALGSVATLMFYFGGQWLTNLFTSDPAVHRAATEYAIILAASQLFLAGEALSEGILAGAGDTRTVFICSVPLNIARVPLAYVLAIMAGFGAPGVWWAINITTMLKAALKSWSVWRGRWMNLKI